MVDLAEGLRNIMCLGVSMLIAIDMSMRSWAHRLQSKLCQTEVASQID